MKHSVSQRPRKNGVELVQACATLFVLFAIYMFSTTYTGNTTSLREPPQKPVILTAQYWNEKMGYGFSSIPGDSYIAKGSGTTDQVEVRPGDGLVYHDNSVRVSFYSQRSIADIESQHTGNTPRTYSRLPGGIAMIEGDLSSERAKTVLTTLHSR